MLDLGVSLNPRVTEHKGYVDMLHTVLTYIRTYQGGVGCVAVSPR